jgi:hypothetical protein
MALKIDPKTGLPIIPKSWLRTLQDPERWNESTGQMEAGQKRIGFTDEAQQLLGGQREGFNYGGNYDWGFDVSGDADQYGGDPILRSVLRKSGEREGTRYRYEMDENGDYVPVAEPVGTETMYTNNGDTVKKALMAAGAVAGGGLLGNLAMTGNMFTAAAPGAMNFGGALGSAAGGGTGATGSSLAGGLSQAELAALIEKHETPMHWPMGTVNRAIADTVRKAEQQFRTECDEPVAM